MSKAESRPTPQGILSWVGVSDLLPDQKLIFTYLYFNRFTNSVGCYQLPIPMASAELSMKELSLTDSLIELSKRSLLNYDQETGEVFINHWFNFHVFNKKIAIECRERDIRRIRSDRLKQLVIPASVAANPMEKWRPVPTNLLSQIEVVNLLPDQKLIFVYLWFCVFTNSCGCYQLPIFMAAAELSLKEAAFVNALQELERRGLIKFDLETSEVLVERWFSFHKFNLESSKNICREDFEKIQSKRLKMKLSQRINNLLPNSILQQQKDRYKKSAIALATKRDKKLELAFDEINDLKEQVQNLQTTGKAGQSQNR
jgi:hypothetical protein